MESDWVFEEERLQIEQIRALDMEELQIEEVDGDSNESSSEDDSEVGDGGASPYGGFTFDTGLPSLHTYLGDIDDTQGRVSFLDGGAVLNLPMFYLEGVVLFPEATLPLRVVQPRFKASVEKAINQSDTRYTIGVVRVYRHPDSYRLCCSTVGTTAEIRQYKQLEDGSLNVVTRGRQRFCLRRMWIDVEGAPCGEVQIIQEDTPLRTPKDAFGQLASIGNFQKNITCSRDMSQYAVSAKRRKYEEEKEIDLDSVSDASIESNNSVKDLRTRCSSIDTSNEYEIYEESTSSDDGLVCESRQREHVLLDKFCEKPKLEVRPAEGPVKGGEFVKGWSAYNSNWSHRAPRAFWPHWVYRMYDAYSLARRAADMWKRIVGVPNMDGLANKPDVLSFYIASKIPVSESSRQKLLEIDGISYRLRKEIQLLELFDIIRCKTCQSVIAKRSDMVVMSSDGPLNAYANPHGCVHEVMTLYNAKGLALNGSPVKEHTWFPGYAWTITNCATCESNIGWLFTATNRNLKPKSFWGIRSSQVADEAL